MADTTCVKVGFRDITVVGLGIYSKPTKIRKFKKQAKDNLLAPISDEKKLLLTGWKRKKRIPKHYYVLFDLVNKEFRLFDRHEVISHDWIKPADELYTIKMDYKKRIILRKPGEKLHIDKWHRKK